MLEQTAYPLLDCPDSYHAEGFASSYAVRALARHFPSSPDVQECVIIGDNSSILNYWRRTARVRRPNLITELQRAQLLAATEPPRISWRYVPREANKEADFLAGIASAAAKSDAQNPITVPIPTAVGWRTPAALALAERSAFCLVECPTFHALDLASIRHGHPSHRSALEAYIATVVRKHVPHRIDGDDCLGRAVILPHLEELRTYLRSCLGASPAGRAAMRLVKLLPTLLLNSSVEHAMQVLEQHQINPGPELVMLLRRIAAAKPELYKQARQPIPKGLTRMRE